MELPLRKEEYQIQDELDLLLDPEVDRYTASPFVLDIEDYPLPMRLQTAADAVRCKTFPMFLEGKARQWFQGLPPRSIRSFSQLARLFPAQFVSSRAFSKSTTHLMTVHQAPEESLRQYMVRFNNKSLQIRDRDDKVVMAAFVNGLRKQKMYTEFVEKPPKSVREMLDRAHEKANAKEANRLKGAQERLRDDRRRKSTELGDAPPGQGRKNTFDLLLRSRPFEKEKAWTSLTAPRARVIVVMEQESLSRPPRPLADDKSQRDQGLYCAYHRDVGHDTEDYRHLKKDIEKLIRRGHLGQFIRDGRTDQRQGGTNRNMRTTHVTDLGAPETELPNRKYRT
ncbi:uncharacterized protein LOC113780448 [Coffea eugenioides]|uniref:uncharacterized protein LOC113780448 n=1 Tax=Coffea eugenioides TaxID=49369 RepID=UPI000F614227|nr:uncharacterized protein LOC113780448 [Coffea eugenioides]